MFESDLPSDDKQKLSEASSESDPEISAYNDAIADLFKKIDFRVTVGEKNRNKAFAEVRDMPTKEDSLGFKRWTDYVTKFIGRDFGRDFTEATQITIGVYGEWGSGKTSFLRMVERQLKEIDISPIWFDAWKYDKEDNLWAALIQKILDDAKVRGNLLWKVCVRFLIWKDSISFRDGMWGVFKSLFPAILRLIIFIAGLIILLGRVASRKNLTRTAEDASWEILPYETPACKHVPKNSQRV